MRLVGYVDGVEVKFDFTPPNTFTAIIPKQLDGIYILQLHAIDESGNQTNYSNIFVNIDFQKMSFRVLDENYPYKIDENEILSIESGSDFHFSDIPCILFREITSGYSYREVIK
jgi:hypothetical protein